jgi:hypothetical protein
MITTIYIIAAMAVIGSVVLVLSRYYRLRGTRLVTCPETCEPVAVEVKTARAALSSLAGEPSFRLRDCTRWPERRNCGQECLAQIEIAPEECLVRTILTDWYKDKTCVLCGKPLGQIEWLEQKPALLSPDKQTVEWHDIKPEQIPELLTTHQPVCWNCYVAETFLHMHPELVVERPWKNEESRWIN